MTTKEASDVLDFWEAFDRVDPIGDDWHQSAMLAMQIYQCYSAIMARGGQATDPKPFDDFMPPRWLPPDGGGKPVKKGLSLSQMREKQEQIYGN